MHVYKDIKTKKSTETRLGCTLVTKSNYSYYHISTAHKYVLFQFGYSYYPFYINVSSISTIMKLTLYENSLLSCFLYYNDINSIKLFNNY